MPEYGEESKNFEYQPHTDSLDEVHTIMLDPNKSSIVVGQSSVIGKRSKQQDSIKSDDDYAYMQNGRMIAVLCDGMGGLSGGERASRLCTETVYNRFHLLKPGDDINRFYKNVIRQTDLDVAKLQDETGNLLNAGTTLVSVVITDSRLFWISVGDSRIYIIRSNEILCVTNDHNFKMILDKKVRKGEITEEEAENNPQKEALVSYIGMNGIKYIDMSIRPIQLVDGDYIILCSDGLYRTVTETEMKDIVCLNGKDVQMAAEILTELTVYKDKKNQDNASVIVIRFDDSG